MACTGNMMEFWNEGSGSTTGFKIDKETHIVTAIG